MLSIIAERLKIESEYQKELMNWQLKLNKKAKQIGQIYSEVFGVNNCTYSMVNTGYQFLLKMTNLNPISPNQGSTFSETKLNVTPIIDADEQLIREYFQTYKDDINTGG